MRELEHKRKIKRFLYTPITLILLLIATGMMVKAVLAAKEKENLSIEHLERAKAEAEDLRARHTTVAAAVSFLKTEEGIDAELRSKYRLVREGEGVAVIVEEPVNEVPTKNDTPSLWQRFTEWLKK